MARAFCKSIGLVVKDEEKDSEDEAIKQGLVEGK